MAILDRIFGITIMTLILIFAIIHLGVSIGIIIPYRKYGDIFRPQIGLSAFNIVISFFGFLTGILGLITIFTNAERFGKIVTIVSSALGIFALSSLIAAIVINSVSLNYITTHFSNNLMNYETSADARNNIDFLQQDYQCCGVDIWVDWAHVDLGATSSMPNSTTTVTITNGTTTVAITNSTTTVANTNTTTSTISSTLVQTSSIITTTPASILAKKKRDVDDLANNRHLRQLRLLSDFSRRKRQAMPSTYGGIEGLPLQFSVTLPRSCCTTEAILTSNNSDSYCISNANGAVNHFYTGGCSKPIDVTAGNQVMGIGVINCFMVVLAFVAIPLLLETPSE